MTPLLSVVIANYNYGRFLAEAIESIVSQGMEGQIEVLVCDGGSADNSVEVIKKYVNGLPACTSYEKWAALNNSQCSTLNPQLVTWWCSEPDGGQSEAFNKGFTHARGRFLTWLNADDVMMPGTLAAFARAVDEHPKCEWFVGGVMWLNKNLQVIKCGRGRSFSKARAECGVVSVWGPSSFFSRELYERAGRVDERFFYKMDTDLWRRFYYKCGATYLPFIDYAWGLRLHEEAKMSAHNFSESGQQDKNHPKWKRIAQEEAWMEEYYKPRVKMTFFRKLSSAEIRKSLMGRIDSIRYKGKFYKECFK